MLKYTPKQAIRAAVGALLLSSSHVSAQYGSQYLANLGSENFSWYMNSILIRQMASPEAHRGAARAKTARQNTGSTASKYSALELPTAKRLAAGYPMAARQDAEKLFAELLVSYRQIEVRFGIPQGDVGGAIAALVAGSYMGLHNADFPDAQFKTLVNQMRRAIAKDPGFAATTLAERNAMYEEMATLGMMLATTQMALKKTPNAAAAINMRRAGRRYLEELTSVDADTLKFGPEGLSAG